MTLPELFDAIPAWTSAEERELLTRLAKDVPVGGLILEVGCLYGGTTAVLAKGAPKAQVISMDDFSWSPEGYGVSSAERTRENLTKIGVKNSSIMQGDSRELCKGWNKPIDLLWVDGGHSFEYVYSDIFNFGRFAEVIAVHDYRNPAWVTIEKAIETFLAKNRIWHIAEVTGMICVLRKIV